MFLNPVLINGEWRQADHCEQFHPYNPTSGEPIDSYFPVSTWQDCEAALDAAVEAYRQLQQIPDEQIALFLESYAALIEANREALVEMAHRETGLAKVPRLADIELPRTTNQLRLAAKAVREASWRMPTIDRQNNIRSLFTSIGPVAVFGPNNFPFAFGSMSGGDFAAAIAAGNPVIAKAHPLHPGTSRLFAELALSACQQAKLPTASVQMLYALADESGLKLVGDARIAATAFTGSRRAGLQLKAAAESAGNLIYLEMSSLNPVILLAGALEESSEKIAEEFANSCIAAAGQLCTKPGLLIIPTGEAGEQLVELLIARFQQASSGTLLSPEASGHLHATIAQLTAAGADSLTEHERETSARFCFTNSLLSITAQQFIDAPQVFEKEMFGNASLIIRSPSTPQTIEVIARLSGQLTGCIYSHSDGRDDDDYQCIEALLKNKVGRLLNDKMPTGVAVSPAMNHGGPFPASGHPGFSAVGMPVAMKRFSALKCFDNVRQSRLPELLQDKNPRRVWRSIDGAYTTDDI